MKKTPTIILETALKRLGLFYDAEKVSGDDVLGLYRVRFQNGYLFQYKCKILAIALGKYVYISDEWPEGQRFPKAFRDSWLFREDRLGRILRRPVEIKLIVDL